ncbi:MAG: hypothetical protein ACKVWV_19825 [Planctomycetota bacterium]
MFELRSVFPNRLWLLDPTGLGSVGENSHVMILATVAGYVSSGNEDLVVLERVSLVPVQPAQQEAPR